MRRSRSKAGCAPGATPRRAFRSCTCRTDRRSIRCRWSRRTRCANYTDEVLKLTAGCAVEATGTIVPSPAKGQPFEMQASAIKVIGWVDDPDTYPIQPKPHTLEFLREVAHLRPRTNVIGAATRVRHTLAQAIHRFFDENGFFWVNTPIITSSDAEGAGALFRVSTLDLANLPRTPQGKVDFAQDFFGREAFLTVSGQLNVEAYCLALTKVYTFGPTFRAENSNTSRHLAEFWMIEPEIAFADLSDDATLAERLLKFTFETLAEGTAGRSRLLRRADREGAGGEAGRDRQLRIRAHGLRRGDRGAGAGQGEVRIPGEVGHRPAVGARALSHREARQEAGDRDELPQGHQGVLHAGERRRQHRRGDGRAGAGHRRDHRRQPARGAARRAGRAHDRARHRQGALRLVPRPAPLRHGAARRLRARLRAHARLRHRPRQRARRDPVPAHARDTRGIEAGGCAAMASQRCSRSQLPRYAPAGSTWSAAKP